MNYVRKEDLWQLLILKSSRLLVLYLKIKMVGKKQLTCTSWGKYNPKFDLRAWDSEYTSMKKGITLSLEELIALRDILNESDLEAILAEAIEEKQASKE